MKPNYKKLFLTIFPIVFVSIMLICIYFSYKHTGEFNIIENVKATLLGSILASAIATRLLPNAKKAQATKRQLVAIRTCLICLLISFAGFGLMHAGHEVLGTILAIPSGLIAALTVLYMYLTKQNVITID